ncbi:ankyrin repeat domain-containing protein 26-like [Eptesicus fuscus]|uniref:ankyrin repeat domain-containing protein 26-like n=1 Tax=Eptesicus fuscus TaxID=29078 RepID=UPI0024044A06|nr:ankyrin repeat domain-containing protein 26-like [Eptesicus fuscus]
MDSPTSAGSSGVGARMPHYGDQHMGEIHKAASEGNLERVKEILLFRKNIRNDRDMMSRTALHVACGNGHPEVVRLLARRHCLLNLRDIDNKTALIHAIQCGQEECATILLDHGADPNVVDIHGNTALHYAVHGHNTAIVEKLLSPVSNMEARNKNDFTPLSRAKYENKMVQFLVPRSSKVHPMESNQQPPSKKKEKRRHLESPESKHFVTHLQKSLKQTWSRGKSNKENFLYGLRVKGRIGNSLISGFHAVAEKNMQTSSEREVSGNTYAGDNDDSDRNGLRQQSNNEQTDTQQPNDNINENTVVLMNKVEERKEPKNSKREESGNMHDGADDSDSHGLSQHSNREQTDTQQPNDKINENAVILMNKVEEQKTQTSSKREVSGNMQDGAEDDSDSAGVRKRSSTEHSDEQQLPLKENKSDRNGFPHWWCRFYRKHRIGIADSSPTSDRVVFKVEGEKKQTISEKEVSGNMYAGDNSDRNGLRPQRNSEQTDTQKPNDKVNENKVFLMNKVEEKKEQTSSKKEESGNIYDGADDSDSDGLSQHSNSKETGIQHPNDKINENTVILMNKIEEKKEHSVGVRQKSNSKPSKKRHLQFMKNVESDRNGFPHWWYGFYRKHRIGIADSSPTSDRVVFKSEGEKKQTINEKEVSVNMDAGAGDNSDRNGLRPQRNSEQTDTQKPNDKVNENKVFLMNKVEEKKEQTSSKKEESGNIYDGADDSDNDGLSQHSNSKETGIQQPNDQINENTVILMNKIEEKKEHSVGVRQKSNSKPSKKQQLPIMKNVESDRNGFPHWYCGFYSKRRIGIADSCPTSDNVVFKPEGEKKQTSNEKEVSVNMYAGAGDNSDRNGLRPQRNSEQTDTQKPNDKVNENKVFLMNKIEEKKEHSVGVRQKSNSKPSKKQQLPYMKNVESDSKRRIGIADSCSTLDSVIFKFDTILVGEDVRNDFSLFKFTEACFTALHVIFLGISNNNIFNIKHSSKPEGEKKQTSNEKEVSVNMYAGAGDNSDRNGLRHQRSSEQTGTQKPNDKVNENKVFLMNKIEEKKEHSVGVRQKSNSKPSKKQQLPYMKNVESDSKRRIGIADSCSTLDSVIFKVEGEKKQTSSVKEVSGNTYDGVNDSDRNGLRHQSKSEQTDTQQLNDKINENSVFLMNKVEEKKEQKSSKRKESGNMFDVANDDTHSVGVRQKCNSEQSDKHQFPNVENVDSDRLTLQKDKEKRQKTDVLYKKNMAHLRKKEGQSTKAVEMDPKVENTIGTQVMALKTVRGNKVVEEQNDTQRQLSEEQNASILQDGILTKHPCKPKGRERAHKKVLSQVSDSYEKEECLLHENHILKDKIAKLTLELDTQKNQIKEMQKQYFEDIVIVKEKNDHFQKTVTEALLQHNEKFEVLRAQLTMQSTKLEDEQQNRGRLEAEGDSYRSRRATVIEYHEHCETSKGDLQVTFKKGKEECFCSQDKKNSDMSDLKHSIEMFSQQLSKFESQFNHLEIELHCIREALRDRTFVLQGGEGDQSQTQSPKKETEHMYQQEPGKANKVTGKQESLQERLSHLERENKLPEQHLDQAHNKADRKGKRVIKIQDQLAEIIKILQANSEKQGLMLKETCKELTNEWHLLKENIHQYENDKAEKDAIVRELQGQLADTQRKLSSTESLLKHHREDSQCKIQALQKELEETRSQLQHEKEETNKFDVTRSQHQSLVEGLKQKNDVEKSMTRSQDPLNMPKNNFNEEHSLPTASKLSLLEVAMETMRFHREVDELVADSKRTHRPEENTAQQEIELQELNKKCDEMTHRVEWWKQEAIRVRREMEISRERFQEEERRLDRLGKCANPYLAYRLEQVRQTFQF